MSVLKIIRERHEKKISPSERVRSEIEPPRPAPQDRDDSDQAGGQLRDGLACPTCGEPEWWVHLSGGNPLCWNCRPPGNVNLVREKYFFDDRGDRWNCFLEAGDDGPVESAQKVRAS